ncbi:MAG: hypothetical protein AAF447_18445 [Myxococcota bacterium]
MRPDWRVVLALMLPTVAMAIAMPFEQPGPEAVQAEQVCEAMGGQYVEGLCLVPCTEAP